MFAYRLFGLDIVSQIDLGGQVRAIDGQPDVIIRRGAVPMELADAAQVEDWFSQSPGLSLLCLPVARFLVRDGREIVVDGDCGDAPMLVWRLLGLAFGALLHQRGIMALHSTVVRAGEGAIGLVGNSGAGKSTLAAFLGRRGHDLLIDDLCALQLQQNEVLVQPGPARLRLWGDMVEAMGLTGQAQLDPALDKYELPPAPAFADPVGLRALVALETGPEIQIEPLDARGRFATAIDHTYGKVMLPGLGQKAGNFAQCRDLARRVPMFRLTRPKDLAAIDAVMDRLVEAVTSLAPADLVQ